VCWDDGLWTLSFGSHNFMVTALGSCVKWPLMRDHIDKVHSQIQTGEHGCYPNMDMPRREREITSFWSRTTLEASMIWEIRRSFILYIHIYI
jgi:hypothetical protein